MYAFPIGTLARADERAKQAARLRAPPPSETPPAPPECPQYVELDGQLSFVPPRPPPIPLPLTVRAIVKAVCDHTGVRETELCGKRRDRQVMVPRLAAYYLATTLTKSSLPQVGRFMGGRDHTTILHGRRKSERMIDRDPDFAKLVADLEARLMGGQS
jgi:hypothetical protein